MSFPIDKMLRAKTYYRLLIPNKDRVKLGDEFHICKQWRLSHIPEGWKFTQLNYLYRRKVTCS